MSMQVNCFYPFLTGMYGRCTWRKEILRWQRNTARYKSLHAPVCTWTCACILTWLYRKIHDPDHVEPSFSLRKEFTWGKREDYKFKNFKYTFYGWSVEQRFCGGKVSLCSRWFCAFPWVKLNQIVYLSKNCLPTNVVHHSTVLHAYLLLLRIVALTWKRYWSSKLNTCLK